MSYRIAPTLPYLIAGFAPLGLGLSLISPRLAPADYVLGFGFAVCMVSLAVLARRYLVILEADKLIVTALRRREYPFADMVRLDVGPARGGAVAALTMRDGRQVVIPGYLSDFRGFVQALRAAAKLPRPAVEDPR